MCTCRVVASLPEHRWASYMQVKQAMQVRYTQLVGAVILLD